MIEFHSFKLYKTKQNSMYVFLLDLPLVFDAIIAPSALLGSRTSCGPVPVVSAMPWYNGRSYHWYWAIGYFECTEARATAEELETFAGHEGRFVWYHDTYIWCPGRWWWAWDDPPIVASTGRPPRSGPGAAGGGGGGGGGAVLAVRGSAASDPY